MPHTEAPWGVYQKGKRLAVCRTGYPAQRIATLPESEHAEADADLIAAAPRMLEALLLVSGFIREGHESVNDKVLFAIKKARGEL